MGLSHRETMEGRGQLMSLFANRLETRKEGEITPRLGDEAGSKHWTRCLSSEYEGYLGSYTQKTWASQSKRVKKVWGGDD